MARHAEDLHQRLWPPAQWVAGADLRPRFHRDPFLVSNPAAGRVFCARSVWTNNPARRLHRRRYLSPDVNARRTRRRLHLRPLARRSAMAVARTHTSPKLLARLAGRIRDWFHFAGP